MNNNDYKKFSLISVSLLRNIVLYIQKIKKYWVGQKNVPEVYICITKVKTSSEKFFYLNYYTSIKHKFIL